MTRYPEAVAQNIFNLCNDLKDAASACSNDPSEMNIDRLVREMKVAVYDFGDAIGQLTPNG